MNHIIIAIFRLQFLVDINRNGWTRTSSWTVHCTKGGSLQQSSRKNWTVEQITKWASQTRFKGSMDQVSLNCIRSVWVNTDWSKHAECERIFYISEMRSGDITEPFGAIPNYVWSSFCSLVFHWALPPLLPPLDMKNIMVYIVITVLMGMDTTVTINTNNQYHKVCRWRC